MAELNYGRMMQRAMQGLVAEALSVAAEHGLPGEHHFYITFQTSHAGVDIPEWLHERFPEELVIVLQHEFDDLAVTADRFSVTLSFSDRPATLVVPFDAILEFADPSAPFGLRFDPSEAEDADGVGGSERRTTALDPSEDSLLERARRESGVAASVAEPSTADDQMADDGEDDDGDDDDDPKPDGRVVRLDQFRKK